MHVQYESGDELFKLIRQSIEFRSKVPQTDLESLQKVLTIEYRLGRFEHIIKNTQYKELKDLCLRTKVAFEHRFQIRESYDNKYMMAIDIVDFHVYGSCIAVLNIMQSLEYFISYEYDRCGC